MSVARHAQMTTRYTEGMELLFSLLSFVLAWWQPAPQPASLAEVVAPVVRVIDGDTIDVLLNGTTTRIRYIGIDTPETYHTQSPQCYSREAAARNEALVAGKEVRLVADQEDKDKYERLLRYVYVGDTFVNEALVKEGYAKPMPIKPNTLHAAEFKAWADEAAASRQGLWSVCK